MPWYRHKWKLVFVTIACVVVLYGCTSGNALLADLFIPLPPSAPVQNPPRHPPPVKRPPMVIVQEEVVRPPDIDWKSLYAALPRDNKGVVDWMRALSENQITLKPGIGPDAQPANTTDSEILFVPNGSPNKSALFRHATHTQWVSCKNCHPGLFKKRDENLQFTHDDMEAGKYCGACHFKAVILPSGCKGCHSGKKPAALAPEAAA
jgi:c(7)-type cytochrome triheme protein